MKYLIQLISILSLAITPVFAQTAYETDTTNFYVDNSTNKALDMVNMIICMMNGTAPDKMVNRGPYVANVYDDECEQERDNSGDQSAAAPTSASEKQSSGGGSSGADSTTAGEERKISVAVVDVTRASETDPMIVKTWFEVEVSGGGDDQGGGQGGGDMMMPEMPKMLIYIDGKLTAPPSATSKFGDFEVKMTYTLTAEFDMAANMPAEFLTMMSTEELASMKMPKGEQMGGGYLKSSGTNITFVEQSFQGMPSQVYAIFDTDSISGVSTMEEGYWDETAGEWNELKVIQSFTVDEVGQNYCSKFLSAVKIDWDNWDETTGMPAQSAYTIPAGAGINTGEACFSTDLGDASQNVWKYGVYNTDGTRAELTGAASFSMTAPITADFDGDGTSQAETAYGWASFWGAHIDEQFAAYVNADTVWTKENWDDPDAVAETYKIITANQRVTRIERTYAALNSLDEKSVVMWVNLGDTNWQTKLQSLGFGGTTDAEFSGNYEADTETWTFDKKIDWSTGYSETELTGADIVTYTNTEWLATMTKVWDEWYTETRQMWVWSHDDGLGYEIKKGAMENPTDKTSTNGLVVETSVTLDPTAYPTVALKCIEQCPTQATITATATAAVALTAETAGYPYVVSPFDPVNWPIIASGEFAGEHYNGILASDLKTYTFEGLTVKDGTGTAMGFAASVTEAAVGDASFYWPWDGGASYGDVIKWGVRTGRLVPEADIAKLDCPRSTEDATKYRDDHPIHGTDAAAKPRYCMDAFWDPTKGLNSWYEVSFGVTTWDRQSYVQDQATSAYVEFARPVILKYLVPDNEVIYGSDAGKNVRLEFGGFGDLWGIPGEVIDTITGESLGEFHSGEWKDSYRYVSRFIIEPYNSVDPVLTDPNDDTKTYKVKALEGEEFLLNKTAIVGTLNHAANEDNLPSFALLTDVSPWINEEGGDDNPDSIGAKPTTGLFNDGEPSVVHGVVVATLE